MKKIICVIMLLMLFVACSEDVTDSSVQIGGDESVTPSITLNQTSINFNDHAGTQEITFNSTMAWTAELINERADGWCSISTTGGSAGSGRINVTVTENTTPDDRTASVIIKSGTISRTVRISQKQRDALTVTASTFEVESTKGKIYIEVKANIDFEYTINSAAADWITPIQTRAMKTTTLGFNIAENNTSQRREGTITIHSGDFQEVVTVYQAGSDKNILLSKKEFVVSNEGEEISIDVTSSVDVELEMPDVDWITRNTSRAVSTNTYYFTIAENPTNYQRESYITFKNAEKKLSERVKIVQVQHDAIIIGKAHYEVDKNGEELKIDIQTNADVNISISDNATNWITHIQSRALPTKSIYFEILPYHDYGSRTATITFSSETTSQSVSITQSGIELGTPNNNEIYYTTSNKMTITPDLSIWNGVKIVSNIYDQNKEHCIITFNNDITTIGSGAFSSCSTLTSVTIPNQVTTINSYAFAYCNNITKVTFNSNLKTIEDNAFLGNYSLTSITIPNNVKNINQSAFQECGLTEVNLSEGLKIIGDQAFHYCTKLTNITIPNSVKSIGEDALSECPNLKTIDLGNGLETIVKEAFQFCSALTDITIPDSVTAIGDFAFLSCSALRNVYCKATTPPVLGTDVFKNNANGRKIYVPRESVDTYRTAVGWSDYADDIVEIEANDSYQGTLPILNKKDVASKLLSEWDKGGEGVGYHDLSNRNGGTPDVEGAGNIGYTTSGEWLAYTVYVADAGTYKFTLYGSSSDASGTYGGEYQWYLDDPSVEENALGSRFKQQSGGGWGGPWMPSEPVEFELNEGFQRIILYMHKGAHNLYNFTAEWAE